MSTFNPAKTLESNELLLRAVNENDYNPLFNAASDPFIWEQAPYYDRYKREKFDEWFDDALNEQALVIIDKKSNKKALIGSSRYYEINESSKEVAIGYTFLVRSHWGGNTNRELKNLMLDYAWEHFDKVWLHIARSNIRSRKAAEKINARLSHFGEKNDHPYCWYYLQKKNLQTN